MTHDTLIEAAAVDIATTIAQLPAEKRHLLYQKISTELVKQNQSYSSSLFTLIYALDLKSMNPLAFLLAALKGADRA